MTNRDALVEAIGKSNVIAILGGHYHKAKVDRYKGRDFIQLPSSAAGGPGELMVVRITTNRLVAIPYDYRQRNWSEQPGKMLDTPIIGPR